jgi:hypothetical protein
LRPIVVSFGPFAAASANLLAASQTPVSGVALTLATHTVDGSTGRRILLTYGVEASARTLVLTGTNWAGTVISETLAIPSGAGGTVKSVLDYVTLTSAVPAGGGWSAAVTLGTASTDPVASSPWVRVDDYGFSQVSVGVDVTGTLEYTVEGSVDDPNLMLPQVAVPPASMKWVPLASMVEQTLSQQAGFLLKPLWVRCTLNSYTAASASLTMTVTQAGGKYG